MLCHSEHAPSDAPGGSVGPDLMGFLRGICNHGDIMLAFGIMAILSVLILPMPTWLLDIALAISVTSAVLVMMTCLFIQRPLEFSSFPTVLLITTLLRLSLNLASTRLILGHGPEGTEPRKSVV